MRRIHATEQFFPTFRIHGCEFAHQLVARFPFRVFAQANADRKKRGDDPNREVRCGHEMNKELKTVGDKRRKERRLTLPTRREIFLTVHRGILAVLCSGVVLASAPLARPQEATSANLPEQLETGEATPTPKVKKKKKERSREVAASASSERSARVIEQSAVQEERTTAAVPSEKKHHVKRRATPAVHFEAPSFSAASELSLGVAQAMAVSAPLPEYPYEAKHANVTGSGVCVMIVDTASGKVTNAMMAQSTGNAILDKVTTETFRRWRFKPGSVSQVRVPISYE